MVLVFRVLKSSVEVPLRVNAPTVSDVPPLNAGILRVPSLKAIAALSLMRSVNAFSSSNVPPVLTVTEVVLPNAPAAAADNVPALTVVVPEYVVAPLRVKVPVPTFVRLIAEPLIPPLSSRLPAVTPTELSAVIVIAPANELVPEMLLIAPVLLIPVPPMLTPSAVE